MGATVKITRATTRVLATLDETPLVEGLPESAEHSGHRELIFLELDTDAGLTGLGLTFWHGALAPALRTAVEALGELVVGHDPTRLEALRAMLTAATGRTSALGSGLFHLALAAVDIACWDIMARAAGKSVCDLAGGFRDRVPAYASGALLRGFSLECLEQTSATLVEMGFQQLKMQCGSEPTPAESVQRVRAVRQAIGPDVDLMCDVNQNWTVHHAVQLGQRLEPYNLFWLEDPVTAEDHAGLARVAAALTTPIAAGEYAYGLAQFRQLLEAHAMDVVMIDLLRVGGITPWLKVAHLAEAFNLPVVSHRIPEIHVQLVSAIPNGLTVEYRPFTAGIFEEVPRLVAGELVVPDRPGLGLRLDPAAIRRYGV
jgi:L-alanine-DL-glutamate epimerase-like enolase superfamily enzyme